MISRRMPKAVWSETTAQTSQGNQSSRMPQGEVGERREVAVEVRKGDIDGIDIEREVETVRGTGQGVQTDTGIGTDTETEKSGESEAEVQIGERDDIEAEARIGGDVRETIAN